MGMTIIEKILASHAGRTEVAPGELVDVQIDARVARDFGGANVVQHMEKNRLEVHDLTRTFFTFDCNPTGSDQKYAANQQICRKFARERGIRVFDINKGIGTHIMIEEGRVYPGATAVSTDSHANILGAICAFGQGRDHLERFQRALLRIEVVRRHRAPVLVHRAIRGRLPRRGVRLVRVLERHGRADSCRLSTDDQLRVLAGKIVGRRTVHRLVPDVVQPRGVGSWLQVLVPA
mgnify:CR=1 FL=1